MFDALLDMLLQLKTVRVCGPRYWPHVIELVPEGGEVCCCIFLLYFNFHIFDNLCSSPTDEPWWSFGNRNDPFNSGILHVKRKVGACSYVDDPVGCQSLLSRAMHKVWLAELYHLLALALL